MCAMAGGRSVESTLGFTALDGLPMGTRPGQIDPGVVLYLLTEKGMDAGAVQRFLYNECGLKGLSGVSNDMRELARFGGWRSGRRTQGRRRPSERRWRVIPLGSSYPPETPAGGLPGGSDASQNLRVAACWKTGPAAVDETAAGGMPRP